MALSDTLEEIRNAFEAGATPREDIRILDAHVEFLSASGAAEQALPEGTVAPEFAMPATTGATVTLLDLRAGGPAVLVWFRGNW